MGYILLCCRPARVYIEWRNSVCKIYNRKLRALLPSTLCVVLHFCFFLFEIGPYISEVVQSLPTGAVRPLCNYNEDREIFMPINDTTCCGLNLELQWHQHKEITDRYLTRFRELSSDLNQMTVIIVWSKLNDTLPGQNPPNFLRSTLIVFFGLGIIKALPIVCSSFSLISLINTSAIPVRSYVIGMFCALNN